ncbi:MAG: RidA family protein [Gemmatimonadetes bacterium]|nr:RidA family protein [Gemmatimonadota bacterium]
MPERIELNPPWPWASKFRIAQGVQVGNRVYVSGQVAFVPRGNVVGRDNMGAQASQVFENIRAVLAEAGATMDDVVKITAFITDMSRYADYTAARAEAFPNNIPASATVATPTLVSPDLLVEVDAVAEIGSGKRA